MEVRLTIIKPLLERSETDENSRRTTETIRYQNDVSQRIHLKKNRTRSHKGHKYLRE